MTRSSTPPSTRLGCWHRVSGSGEAEDQPFSNRERGQVQALVDRGKASYALEYERADGGYTLVERERFRTTAEAEASAVHELAQAPVEVLRWRVVPLEFRANMRWDFEQSARITMRRKYWFWGPDV